MHEPLQPLCIPEVLQNTLEFVKRPLEYHSIQVRSTALPDLPRALGHPMLLQTLFMHFILLSVDRFKTQDGHEKEISLDFTQEGEGLRLHYRDNAKTGKPWTYADKTLAEQMLQRLHGSLEERPAAAGAWELIVTFKTPHSPHDANATREEECS
jgi:hypothetical protein